MRYLLLLLLYCSVYPVFAEHTEEKNQVYNQHSKLTVSNINQVVEVLRNPTVMSGSFREALKNIKSSVPNTSAFNSSDDDQKVDMPFIEVVAKVLSKDSPSTVVLRVNDHTVHLSEGSTSSQLVNKNIVDIRVDKISKNSVTIFLSPFAQTMVLQ